MSTNNTMNTSTKTYPKVIELNVGGRFFSTTMSTLCKYPESMLARMFGGNFELVQDSAGRYFIDRDGELFGHILNFLRNGKILIPASKRDLAEVLFTEADFFGIEPLINYLREVVEEIEAERNKASNSKAFYNELRQASLKKWQEYANNIFDTCFPDIKEKLIKAAIESNIMNCLITFHQATTDESINQVTVERSIGNCWNNPNVAIGGTIKINIKVRYAQISIPNGYSAMQMNAVAEVWCEKLEKLGFEGVKYKPHPFEVYFKWSKYLTDNFVRLIN